MDVESTLQISFMLRNAKCSVPPRTSWKNNLHWKTWDWQSFHNIAAVKGTPPSTRLWAGYGGSFHKLVPLYFCFLGPRYIISFTFTFTLGATLLLICWTPVYHQTLHVGCLPPAESKNAITFTFYKLLPQIANIFAKNLCNLAPD